MKDRLLEKDHFGGTRLLVNYPDKERCFQDLPKEIIEITFSVFPRNAATQAE